MGQLTEQMGSPHEGQKLGSYVAPGGTQVVKASSLEGVQGTHRGKEGLCFHWGEGDAQKENEGLLLEKWGRGELPAASPILLWPKGGCRVAQAST